jgi:hypothetical protein
VRHTTGPPDLQRNPPALPPRPHTRASLLGPLRALELHRHLRLGALQRTLEDLGRAQEVDPPNIVHRPPLTTGDPGGEGLDLGRRRQRSNAARRLPQLPEIPHTTTLDPTTDNALTSGNDARA